MECTQSYRRICPRQTFNLVGILAFIEPKMLSSPCWEWLWLFFLWRLVTWPDLWDYQSIRVSSGDEAIWLMCFSYGSFFAQVGKYIYMPNRGWLCPLQRSCLRLVDIKVWGAPHSIPWLGKNVQMKPGLAHSPGFILNLKIMFADVKELILSSSDQCIMCPTFSSITIMGKMENIGAPTLMVLFVMSMQNICRSRVSSTQFHYH